VFYLVLNYCNELDPSDKNAFTTPLQAILDTFILTLGEVNFDFEQLPFMTSYSIIGEVFFTVYLIMGTCILVNMLIAMMDHTQENTNDMPNEWIRQV
jgi:hypothetical protein